MQVSGHDRPALAVIGAGITGLAAAWLLRERFDVTIYEAEARAGGHADTQTPMIDGAQVPVDTGFIVFNDRNYPNLVGFFAALGVVTHDSDMSFGVSKDSGAFEYAGGTAGQLLAQPANLLKPRFWRMLRDILRFNRAAPALLLSGSRQSFGDYLAAQNYSAAFVENYILPMGAAIWSASLAGIKAFPARQFIQFFANHGLLTVNDHPQWRTVTGGSKTYVERVLRDLPGVGFSAAVTSVRRTGGGIEIDAAGASRVFAAAVCCAHADQTLAMLHEPTAAERKILGGIKFQDNAAVLHQDETLMPKRRRAWAAWNFLSKPGAGESAAVCLTYWMNRLQGMRTRNALLVTLNAPLPIDPAKILLRKTYRHPQFDQAAIDAQEALPEIQGKDRIWFAGAWTGFGFHEDGIASAVNVANALGVRAPWQR
jgi:predicted NAD/FAD-binding protein